MKKTPMGAACDARLNEINDQLCFGAFAAVELNRVVTAQAQPSGTMTPVAFPSNPHATRINRPVGDLPAFEATATSTLCASALIAASEHMQVYYRAAMMELRRLAGAPAPTVEGGDDDKLQELLTGLGAPVIPEIFQAVIYLRQRRNNLVHYGALKPWLKDYLDKRGATDLQAYWGTRRTKLFGFDFRSRDLRSFTIHDGYAMMNLLRIGLKTIDGWVAAQLPIDPIAEEIAREIVSLEPGLRNEVSGLTRKTKAYMAARYGASVTLTQIDAPVRRARAI